MNRSARGLRFLAIATAMAASLQVFGLFGCSQKKAEPDKEKINQTPQMRQLRAQKSGDK
jgi:hypothetical protein